MTRRTIKVDYLARVEGEGALKIRLEDGRATEVQLNIFEPPRFFEALLRGRAQEEAPDVTARICGICPVAYMMSACGAIEHALGIEVSEPIRILRRLLYCGEWIESHALHAFMLHAPDFLGFPDAVAMAAEHPEMVKRGLRIKKAGNTLVAAVGGREVHPINVRVGGFYRAPRVDRLRALLPELRWTRGAAQETLRWMAGFEFPDFERDYEFVALRHTADYPFCEGRLVSTRGLDIEVADYDRHFVEHQVPYSTALHSILRERGTYVCGPLARFNLNADRLGATAREAAETVGLQAPCRNPFKGLLVRMVEIVQALDEAIDIIESYRPPEVASLPVPRRAATGYGCTEAPRGILYHRYALSEDGLIEDARIVPPTSQNQGAMEEDLVQMAPELAARPLDEATWLAEQAVRNYDPCISCATHFLTLRIERG